MVSACSWVRLPAAQGVQVAKPQQGTVQGTVGPCGTMNAPGAKFCSGCGSDLVPPKLEPQGIQGPCTSAGVEVATRRGRGGLSAAACGAAVALLTRRARSLHGQVAL